jgi:hypothetical protein
MQEGPRGEEALRGLDGYERMVNTFAQNAKAYWGSWGPLGEPMVRGVEAWTQMQRAYLQWLRQSRGERGSAPSKVSRYQEGDSVAGGSAGKEAQRIAGEAQRVASEAQREAAREAERVANEAQRSSPEEEGVRGAIRESVRRSEEAAGRGRPRAAPAAAKEDRADAEGLPLEDYDSLSVNRVTQRLGELSVGEIERLRDYEAENKGRRSLIDRFERRIRAAREGMSTGEA